MKIIKVVKRDSSVTRGCGAKFSSHKPCGKKSGDT